jgi:hypothetical protein
MADKKETKTQRLKRLRAEIRAKAAKQSTRNSGKGGAIVKRGSSAITKSKGGALAKTGSSKPTTKGGKVTTTSRAKGPRGMRTRLPPGKPGGALAKNRGLGGGGIGTGAAQAAGLYLAGKMAETIGKKGQSKMSKLGITSKSKSKPAASKPKMKPAPGMSKGAVAAAKKGAAEANKAKSPVKSSVSPKKTSKGVNAPKAKSKAPVAASKPRSAAPKPKATSGKNPYRMPQGAERKDKSYKAVQELKGMVKASKARQNAQMPKKPAAEKKLSKNEQNLRRRRGM